MFTATYFSDIHQQLIEHGVTFDPGLTTAELHEIEERNQVKFPPELAAFLQMGVPRSFKRNTTWEDTRFPDWRGDPDVITEDKKWLLEGILFDVVESNKWIPE
jgi:hypothetical protein